MNFVTCRTVRSVMIRTVLLLGVLTFGFYYPALFNEFSRDDIPIVLQNSLVQSVRGIDHIGKIFSEPYWKSIGFGLYRPLTTVSFACNYSISAYNPFSYHLFNVFLHAVISILLFQLLLRLTGEWSISFWSSALFAVHPITTEVVATIVGRSDLLSIFFMLVALLLVSEMHVTHVKIALSGLFILLAMLSKESAVIATPLIFLIDSTLLRKKSKQTLKTIILLRWKVYLISLLATGSYFVVKMAGLGYWFLAPGNVILFLDNPIAHLNFFQRIPGVLNSFGTGIHRLINPWKQCMDYSYNQIPIDHISAWGAIGILWITVTFLSAIVNRRSRSAITFGLFLCLIPILPVSNLIIPIGTICADRLFYLSSYGFCFALVVWILSVKQLHSIPHTNTALLCILVGLLGVRTFNRASIWKNNQIVFEQAVKDAPMSAKAWYNLGTLRSEQKRISKAVSAYNAALKIYPRYKDALYNLASICMNEGQYNDALAYVKKASETDTVDTEVFVLKGIIETQLRQAVAAEASFYRALELDSRNTNALINLGALYLERNELQKAKELFSKAVELVPDSSIGLFNLAYTHEQLGNNAAAITYYDKALVYQPDFIDALLHRCVIIGKMEGEQREIDCLKQGQQRVAHEARFHFYLAEAYRRRGDAQAEVEYTRFLESWHYDDALKERAERVLAAIKRVNAP